MLSWLRPRPAPAAGPATVHAKYAADTMVPPATYAANLDLAATARHVPGAIVECGVWRGGVIAGLAEVFGGDRTYVLCDSFCGLPPAKGIDGPAALAWQRATDSPNYKDNCSADRSIAEAVMARSPARDVRYMVGWFEETLPGFDPALPIAVLRLDGDWYESTTTCLTHLFPRVSPGGLVIIDDYYWWDGCSRAVHDYLSATRSIARVRQWRDDVAYIRVPGAGYRDGPPVSEESNS